MNEKSSMIVLGSTGSVGTQALDVAKKEGHKVLGVSANRDFKQLEAQVRAFGCKYAAMSDIAAIGIMEGLRLEGKRIPEDVSVIGFDNLLECQYSYPKLTTVSQNTEQKAETVSRILFRQIRGEETEECQIKNDVEIVSRQSVRDLRK